MYKILIVEDNAEERLLARKAVRAASHYDWVVHDLLDALYYLCDPMYNELEVWRGRGAIDDLPASEQQAHWDGVITDIHYAEYEGAQSIPGEEQPHGLALAARLKKQGIPVVVCTDVHHHHSQWIEHLCAELEIPIVVDKGQHSQGSEAWDKAVRLLEKEIQTAKASK